MLYGAGEELHQYFVSNRTASLIDLLADSIGSLAGALAAVRRYVKITLGWFSLGKI